MISCPDLSLDTCAPAIAAHATTNVAVEAFITARILTHMNFLHQNFMKDGLIKALRAMASQISEGHFKQGELLASMTTSQMMDNGKRVIKKNEVKSIIGLQPSEEHCQFATMVGGLSGASADSKRRFEQDNNFLRESALGNKYTPSTTADSLSYRVTTMCQYADPLISNGSMSKMCTNPPPSDVDQGKFLLASSIQKSTLDASHRESVNSQVMEIFLDNQPDPLDFSLFENDNVKITYMDHRSVLSRQLLAAHCFRKTFADKMGGNSTSVPFQSQFLSDAGLSVNEIQERLGPNPSPYAQKKLLVDMVMNPSFGTNTTDTKENILRLINGIQSYKMASLYDSLEILHCNELMLSQLVNDYLQPLSEETQERLDIIETRMEQEKKQTDFAQNISELKKSKGGI